MLKTGKRINSNRRYSEEFKRKIVQDFEQGVMSVVQMHRHYEISNSLIYSWIYKYSKYNEKNVRIVEVKNSQTHRINQLEQQVKELERLVGQKQIKADYFEQMIEVAEKEYGIDIKKNSNTPHSGNFKKVEKK